MSDQPQPKDWGRVPTESELAHIQAMVERGKFTDLEPIRLLLAALQEVSRQFRFFDVSSNRTILEQAAKIKELEAALEAVQCPDLPMLRPSEVYQVGEIRAERIGMTESNVRHPWGPMSSEGSDYRLQASEQPGEAVRGAGVENATFVNCSIAGREQDASHLETPPEPERVNAKFETVGELAHRTGKAFSELRARIEALEQCQRSRVAQLLSPCAPPTFTQEEIAAMGDDRTRETCRVKFSRPIDFTQEPQIEHIEVPIPDGTPLDRAQQRFIEDAERSRARCQQIMRDKQASVQRMNERVEGGLRPEAGEEPS